ncbi:hypothetical protein PFISCL1PPCAC_14391 [Pristionchus fissidentatus]|uniref:Uncharacterized protein n=1 Tax=Pristionchus fissidentatus TaxID=1538716 RepID=A0AAV5VZF6_9BILA|nr:hypothetical protein PFISCL1PPCAC_14391 [Pristionchus fissidentatus]
MNFFVAFLLVGSVASQASKTALINNFNNNLSNYLGANTNKAIDLVCTDMLVLKTMDEITAHLMKDIIGIVPASKYLPAMGMLTTFSGCVKKIGSSMDKAISAVGSAFKKQLTPLYTQILNKIKTMQGNKKSQAEILDQGCYTIANNGLTAKLIQSVINAAMTQCTKDEYSCATPPLNTVMITSKYNMVYDAKRG